MLLLRTNTFVLFIFLLISSDLSQSDQNSYVQEACSVTTYQELCISTLQPFSDEAKTDPSKWARAGVSVTLSEAKQVAKFLKNLTETRPFKRDKQYRFALDDCVELLEYTVDELHDSLRTIRELKAEGFDRQMADLSTWLSAALSEESTCLDGFEEAKRGKRRDVVKLIRVRVLNVTYITSNALALLNKLATTGL